MNRKSKDPWHMEETFYNSSASDGPSAHGELNLFECLIFFAKYKKSVALIPAIFAIAAVALSFALPPAFKANTKILPPQQAQSGAAALLAQLGGVAGAAAGAAGIKNPNDLYIGMLKSRNVADNLIRRFDLKAVYDETLTEKTRKELEAKTSISSGKDGLISIDVEDVDPKRATALANGYAEELLRLTKVLAVTEAAQRRVFFETQLNNSKNNLANAEASLKRALNAGGVISVDSESRGVVEVIARLRAQIAAKEIQVRAMGAFVTGNNQDLKRASEELSSARTELARLENGRHGTDVTATDNDKVGLDSMKLLRDVKYHQMLYELLSKQYEVARLDEAKDSSIVQVLDPAQVPERKFKPKRGLILAGGLFLGFVLSILRGIILEMRAGIASDPVRAEQISRLRFYLKRR